VAALDAGKHSVEPVSSGAVVTGDDANDLTYVTRGITVGVAGNIKVTTADGQTFIWAAPAGWSPVRLSRIWLTSLTATGIVAWW